MAIAKWGVILTEIRFPLEENTAVCVPGRSAGADVVWTAEGWRDAFVPLAAIASVAKKLRVGTAIAQMARPPVLTTLGALSMAELTGGKFILGVGTAPKIWNQQWHNLDVQKPGGSDWGVHRMHPFAPWSDTKQSSVVHWNLLQCDSLCPVSTSSDHGISYLSGGRQPPDDSTGWLSHRWTDIGAAQQRRLSARHSASEPAKGTLEA